MSFRPTTRAIAFSGRFGIIALAWLALALSAGTARSESTLIATGSVWKYLADGSNQNMEWRQLAFDDSNWPAGPAQLGYGDGDERTLILSNTAPRPVTTYFRQAFTVPNPRAITNLTIRILRDDGAVGYLNGYEIFRNNMPSGPINFLTPAPVAVTGGSENRFYQDGAYWGYLVPGTNLFAIEIHQKEVDDCSFDFELIANIPVTPPVVKITNPGDGAIVEPGDDITLAATASDRDGGIDEVEFYEGDTFIGAVFTEPYQFVWPEVPAGRHELKALAFDNSGRNSWSSTVHLQVGNVIGNRIVRGPYLQSGSPTSMVVRWRTDWFMDTLVRYGNPEELDSSAADPGLTTEHEIRITGLTPDTTYFYAIGPAESPLAAGLEYFFHTTPTNTKPVRIWVIGDSGTANDAAEEVRNAYQAFTGSQYTHVWLMLGDNAYEAGSDDQYQRAVFEMYPNILRQTVLWPTIGNHDAASVGPAGDIPYLDMFTLPTQGEAGGLPSGTERYYSFDYANIHFVCLDANTSSRLTGGAMLTWLEGDLAATSKEWIIAFWHQPPYSKGTHNSDAERDLIEMRENALPLLESYGVDLVLCGHSHVYERSYLLNGHYGYSTSLVNSMVLDSGDGRENENGAYQKPAGGLGANQGTVYIVCGCSGEGGVFPFPRHPAMAFNLSGQGSVVLDVDGQRLDAKFIRSSGAIDDYFTLRKGLPREGVRPKLEISRAAGQGIVKWPTSLIPSLLEESERIGVSANWRTVSKIPSIIGRKNTVTLDLGGSNRLFRLKSQ